MCGRYSLTRMQGLTKRFLVQEDRAAAESLEPLFNLAPTEAAPIIVESEGRRLAVSALFGLIPFWAKDVKIAYSTINARAETVAEKPAFREAFKKRRCLVPADGYFEWQAEGKVKLPWRVVMKDRGPFAFAGLWDRWKGQHGEVLSFSIITTDTNGLTAKFHERMPVILKPEDEAVWLAEPRADLLKPYPLERMEMYRVSPVMNKATVKGPECVAQIAG